MGTAAVSARACSHALDCVLYIVASLAVCAGPVDAAWEALSSELLFLKQLVPDTPKTTSGDASGRAAPLLTTQHVAAGTAPVACFERLLLAPGGYQSAISTGINPLKKCSAAGGVMDFSSSMRQLMGVKESPGGACSGDTLRVLFVRRENYKAHPRQRGSIVKRLANEAEVYSALRTMADAVQRSAKGISVHVVSGEFSRMTLAQQMQHAHDACVIVGAHGAGFVACVIRAAGCAIAGGGDTRLHEARVVKQRAPCSELGLLRMCHVNTVAHHQVLTSSTN